MGEWRYGDAGDRWPVRPGEVWKVGPHLFGCGDLELGAGPLLVSAASGYCAMPAPRIAYTDPPWTAGLARGFRSKAGLPGAPVDMGALLDRIFEASREATGEVFIEGSALAALDELVTHRGNAAGFALVNSVAITYYHRAKNRGLLHIFTRVGKDPGEWGRYREVVSLDDDETPGLAMRLATDRGDVVADFCLGRGLTARWAHELGRRCVGLELAPRRLACVLDWFARRHVTPEPLGVLLRHPALTPTTQEV